MEDELNRLPKFYPSQLPEAKHFLTKTKKALRALQKQANNHKSKDLQLQAQEAELAGDLSKAKFLRRIHRAETTHIAFLKI